MVNGVVETGLKPVSTGPATIRFTLNENPLCELADADGNVIDDATLVIADAGHQSPVTSREDLLSVYPNPAKDLLNIEYLMETDGMFEAQLVNMHGVVLDTVGKENSKAGLNKVTMNLVDIPNGMYLLRAVYGDQYRSIKVVVNR